MRRHLLFLCALLGPLVFPLTFIWSEGSKNKPGVVWEASSQGFLDPSSFLSESGHHLLKGLELFLEDLPLAEISRHDFGRAKRDTHSPAWSGFLEKIKRNRKLVKNLEAVPDNQEIPVLVEPLRKVLTWDEAEFNAKSPYDRFLQLRQIVNPLFENPDQDENKTALLKKYLKKIRPWDASYARFVEGMTSFSHPPTIEKYLKEQPEFADLIFSKNKLMILSMAGKGHLDVGAIPEPEFTYEIRRENFEDFNFFFAPLDIIQSLASHTESLSSHRGRANPPYYGELKILLGKKDSSSSSDSPPPAQETATRLMKRVAHVLTNRNLFHASREFHSRRPLSIRVFLTPQKKLIPSKDQGPALFTIKQTNSAESEQGGDRIYVFRKEELFKTLTHEIYHHIYADAPFHHGDLAEFTLKQFAIERKDPHGRPLLQEALTEALALVTHIGMTALEMNEGMGNESALAARLWEKEKAFSLFQSAKILYLSGFDRFEEFINPGDHPKRVQETTSTAEYHILKTLLIYDLDSFLKSVMIDQDKNGLSPKEPSVQREELKDLLLKNGRHPQLAQEINSMIKEFKKREGQGNQAFFQSDLFLNQRMSLVEPRI